MDELKAVAVGGTTVVLKAFRGHVHGASKGFSTDVRGWGDAADVRISSTTTEHNQFFLKNSSDKEHDVRVAGELAVRDGQDVSIVRGFRPGETDGTCVAVINHSTGKTTMRRHALLYLAFGNTADRSVQGCLALAASAWALLLGAALIVIALATFAESASGGAMLGALFGAAGVALVIFGWRQLRRPWRERDRKAAVLSKLEAEINAVVAVVAGGGAR